MWRSRVSRATRRAGRARRRSVARGARRAPRSARSWPTSDRRRKSKAARWYSRLFPCARARWLAARIIACALDRTCPCLGYPTGVRMSSEAGKYSPRRVPRHEQRLLRDLRHRVTWWGAPSADPIVLLHGWGDSAETWQFLVDELPDEWSCVALDWRGFGGTEWPSHGYWFPDYFADLEAFLEQVCPHAPARVIAHSMGGNVSTMYAGIRPERIGWIVNLEGIGLARNHPEQAPARYAEWLDQLKTPPRDRRYPTLEVLVDFLVARNPSMP